MYEWLKKLNKEEFYTPIEIDSDNKYYSDLKNKYSEILKMIELNDKYNPIVKEIKKIQDNILKAIQHYYSGDLQKSIKSISTIIKELECNEYVVNTVKENTAFRDYMYFNKDRVKYLNQYLETDVDFFKARLCDDEKNFKFNDMIHIPFNNRGKVSTQRFSIPGLPSIYLGRSAYICWIELGKPADNTFNVSHVQLDDDIKLFSIATNIEKINRYLSGIDDMENYDLDFEKLIKTHLKVWMISIATSYNIKEKNRNFRSEYIVSQLMMLYLKNRNIDGIAYYSKRIPEQSDPLEDLGVNVVLFAKYEEGKDELYSKICQKIKITDSVNFGEFKQIDKNIIYKNENLRTSDETEVKIPIAGGLASYSSTEFRYLEKHIKILKKNSGI
ncbi:MAG: hypothetical protein ACRC76_08640 [Proteocatella sp.]